MAPIRRFLPRRDLVMGFATGYQVETIAPFVEIAAFRRRIRRRGGPVHSARRPRTESLSQGARNQDAGFRRAALSLFGCHAGALVRLSRLSAKTVAKGTRYRNILITDIRDVIVQKPLFSKPCADLEYHFEAPEPRIGACPINSEWVRQWFGDAELAGLAEKRITCAGTLSGRQQGVVNYLDAMTRLIGSLSAEGRGGPRLRSGRS